MFSLWGCAAPGGGKVDDTGPLSIARQGSFFVGGQNVKSDNLSLLPAYASEGTIAVDQVYVRFQEPVGATRSPVVFMLADVGLPGASHMLMQDRHSLKIGAWLAGWLDRHRAR